LSAKLQTEFHADSVDVLPQDLGVQ